MKIGQGSPDLNMPNWYSGFIMHDPDKSWKQDAGFKKNKIS